MPTITRSYHFCAAHKYWNPNWDPIRNEKEFGKDIHVHGHNYKVEISIKGPVNKENGFVVNLSLIDSAVNPIIEKLDHSQIEQDIEWFFGKQPSSENLAIYFWENIENKIEKPSELVNVRIYETERIYTDYNGPDREGL